MSKHQPHRNHNKFLITDRSLNYILRPVQVRKENYPYTYRIENMDEEISVTVDRAWTPHNHLVLDFVGHELFEKAYKHVDEKRSSWKNDGSQGLLMEADGLLRYSEREKIIKDELKPLIPEYKNYVKLDQLCNEWQELNYQNKLPEGKVEMLRNHIQKRNDLAQDLQYYLADLDKVRDLIFGDVIRSTSIEFKIAKVLDRYYKFFKKRRKEYIKNLFRKTSEVRFTFEYPLRVPVIKHIKINGEIQSIIKKVNLKKINIENDKCFNIEIDGNDVKVIFNTFFGSAYLHNILTLNTDWFEQEFLELDGYASAIYRRFFVTRSGNKFDQLPIKDLVQYFDFLKNSSYPKVIVKAFEDIENAGLIYNYKFNRNGGKFSKGFIEVVKSSK